MGLALAGEEVVATSGSSGFSAVTGAFKTVGDRPAAALATAPASKLQKALAR